MTEDTFKITAAMIQRGGNFAMKLARLARAADPENLAKIKSTWPEMWAKYRAFAIADGAQLSAEETAAKRISDDAARGLAMIAEATK